MQAYSRHISSNSRNTPEELKQAAEPVLLLPLVLPLPRLDARNFVAGRPAEIATKLSALGNYTKHQNK